MKKAIRRLRLRKGDIVVVNDSNLIQSLSQIKGVEFPVPIIYAPDGIKRVSKEYLQKILKEKDSEDGIPGI